MQTKLTLSVDPELVTSVKAYATDKGVSVSRLFELFVHSLEMPIADGDKSKLFPITSALSGSFSSELSKSEDDLIAEYLVEKYG